MKVSHLWADLAVDAGILTANMASELVREYWQAVQAGMRFPFSQWARNNPRLDSAARDSLEQLLNEAGIRCLNCGNLGCGADLAVMDAGSEDLCCPACGANSQKRERAHDAGSWSGGGLAQVKSLSKTGTPPARALPLPLVEGLADLPAPPPEMPEQAEEEEETKTERINRSDLESVTTRRMSPTGFPRPASSSPSPAGYERGAEQTPPAEPPSPSRTPTEHLRNLQRIGNWIVEEIIGQGGLGAVYRARHRVLRRRAAIKVLKNPSESMRKRFEREAQVYSDLDHPNVVRLFDYGEEDGQPYLVMEWVEGQSLQALVETHGPMSLAETLHTARQACDALQLAHRLGIIHRDIKPDNMMRTAQQPRIKITDFGIAHVEDSRLTMQGAFLGTPHYMAPEQFKQQSITPAADWYGLGATMVFLLTGRPPFESAAQGHSNAYKLLTSKATSKLPSLREVRTDVSAEFDEFLGRLCASRPEERPSGKEVAHTLRAFAVAAADEPLSEGSERSA